MYFLCLCIFYADLFSISLTSKCQNIFWKILTTQLIATHEKPPINYNTNVYHPWGQPPPVWHLKGATAARLNNLVLSTKTSAKHTGEQLDAEQFKVKALEARRRDAGWKSLREITFLLWTYVCFAKWARFWLSSKVFWNVLQSGWDQPYVH